LAIEATVDANIHNNQINNNAEGIIISNVTSIQDSPSIYDNEICGNTYYNVNNNTNMNYSLFSNCFCDLDSAQIEAYLIDGYDDITKGLINYQIYDSSCTLLLGNVVKFGEGAGLEEAAFEFQFENPIHEQLQLIAQSEVKEMVLQNMSGQTYYFRSSTNNLFDLSQLAPGYYFIVKLGEQRVSKALVKY
jgi:YHS domain-containing protein